MRNRRLIIYSTDGLSTIKTGYKYNNFSYIIVTFFNVKNENMKQLIEVQKKQMSPQVNLVVIIKLLLHFLFYLHIDNYINENYNHRDMIIKNMSNLT